MSYTAYVLSIPQRSLEELAAIQKEAIASNSSKKWHEFLLKAGEDLNYPFEYGKVILEVFFYLMEKRGIDLQDNEMRGFTYDFSDSFVPAINELFNKADRVRFQSKLDPSLYNVEELQSYIDEKYEILKDTYEGFGIDMMDTIRFLHQKMKEMEDDNLLYIVVEE